MARELPPVIIHDVFEQPKQCAYCKKPATLLCDFVVIERRRTHRTKREYLDHRTCDKPLCEDHATNKGNIFFCGKDGCVHSIDYCPGHAKMLEMYPCGMLK